MSSSATSIEARDVYQLRLGAARALFRLGIDVLTSVLVVVLLMMIITGLLLPFANVMCVFVVVTVTVAITAGLLLRFCLLLLLHSLVLRSAILKPNLYLKQTKRNKFFP